MVWQDAVITSGTILFAIALFPSILSKDKPALLTSVTTGIVLLIFGLVYFTLSLWFSAGMVSVTGIMLLILAVQKMQTTSLIRKEKK